ncbi:right-handed parallel beta-helix repeat-containing protein [Paludibaculum fermentans]|uniref:Right-handed parallel beta-helix repeat-containing protein n=1 Tax=Paludibaculum fermentans TaxID=1473598 RepID=A0A7S7NRQ0_PALFE|nr:right-handed parallel beta-helix repeat-containing protein [Paludibaculum fermentans]QOY88592.1 right-handed parallel beta-helix repeat-containing protein [Paludibaculum fermentans]
MGPRCLLFLLLSATGLLAQNATKAGRFTVEHPTLLNLGFEWSIEGDANRNASVSVEFRPAGETTWRRALPLVRIGGENIYRRRENLDYTVPDGFAGSILNLQPGTEYECRFQLSDPDGASGETAHTVKVRTRTEPQPYPSGRTLHIYPADYPGVKHEPSFNGILQAYYGAGLGDWNVVWERRAQPGDTLLVHAGLYKPERLNYVDPMMAPFDGTMLLTLKGTPEKPITIKAAGDGEVIFDGDGNYRLFDVMASKYHIFDGLTFRNTDVALFAGQKEVLGAVGLTVKNCRFENVGFAVWTEYAGSSDFYIADNLILGREDRMRLIGWTYPNARSAGDYGSHGLKSYYAIKVYGPGHVIAHNAIAYFHDAIGISTYGTPEADPDRRASSIDIYGNDIHMSNDDLIESDGGVHNVRVFQNRGINAAQGGYSAQPVFGGPVYFYRNILYNVPSGVAFKFSAKPAGLYVFHNTIIGEQTVRDPSSNMHFRNNLFLGRDTPNRGIMTWANATDSYSSDYNGYRPNRGVAAQYAWLGPAAGQRLYEPKPTDWNTFGTLAEFRAATGQEQHGLEVDFDIFEQLAPPNPATRHAVYHSMDLNFRLKPGGKAVDAGVPIPTVNEGFAGRAPDLGALELGQPEPHYGPRWLTWRPFYR